MRLGVGTDGGRRTIGDGRLAGWGLGIMRWKRDGARLGVGRVGRAEEGVVWLVEAEVGMCVLWRN